MLARGMHPLKARNVTILRMKALTEEHQPKRDCQEGSRRESVSGLHRVADDDQIDGNDVIQQLRHHQDHDAGNRVRDDIFERDPSAEKTRTQ